MIVKNDKINHKQKIINARRVIDLLTILTGDEKGEEKSSNICERIDKLPRSRKSI